MGRRNFARAFGAIVIAPLLIVAGLSPADAGTTILHGSNAQTSFIPSERVEAEGWAQGVGIENEATSDVGGGENVTLIDDGDYTEHWLAFDRGFDGPQLYTVDARVASATEGGTITMAIDDVVVGSVDVPTTGGWQDWVTVTTTIELVHVADAGMTLRLTYSGEGEEPLLNLNWLDLKITDGPPPPSPEPPPSQPETENELREAAVDQMVAALESYAAVEGSFVVAGGGHNGNGHGWAFYEGGTYATSTANVLIAGGHLPANPLHDPLWIDHTSVAGDVLIYSCRDRAAVFTREGEGQPSDEDRQWWDANGCSRYPIDQLGVSYFAVASPRSGSESQRQAAVQAFISALESYGAEHGTYRVDGGGWDGNGHGWAFYEGGRHPVSTANMLIAGGHMPADPLRDELWIDHTSIAGDVLVYSCHDRVGVFTREGDGQPSGEDQGWWDANGCTRYPIDQLGVAYFALSAPL